MTLVHLEKEITACRKCDRLVAFREKIAKEKRKSYMEWDYWGKPVPGYGKPNAKLMILGLAPAAHGGNRTGRVFTGDKSADFLFGNFKIYCGLFLQTFFVAMSHGVRSLEKAAKMFKGNHYF